MSQQDHAQELAALRRELKQKDEYISLLEKTRDAFDQLRELYDQELKDADQRIRAQEIVQDLMSQERREADRIIQAHEQLEAFSTREIEEAQKTIQAHEKLQELSSLEKTDAIQQLSALRNVSELSNEELRQKDAALMNILEVNQFISSILEEDQLLRNIVKNLVETVHAHRALLMLQVGDFLLARSFINLSGDILSTPEFSFSLGIIEKCRKTGQTQLVQLQPLQGQPGASHISVLVMPLYYKEEWKGVLYVDILSDSDTFHRQDQFVAEIFSFQVAISLHNAGLYKRIIEQNGELLRLVNLRSQFITHISRYLKQPAERLAGILNRFQGHPQLNNQENQDLATAAGTVANLITAAEKMLTFEELSREVEDLFSESVDFSSLLDLLREKYQTVMEEKQLTLRCELSREFSSFKANSVIIRTILDEVVGNAIMYNRSGGWVEVKGFLHKEYLTLEVRDNGNGIRREDLERIFEQFYRTQDSPGLNERGAGLGLFMVRNFLRYYGGEIGVESEYGRGSTFTLTFLQHS